MLSEKKIIIIIKNHRIFEGVCFTPMAFVCFRYRLELKSKVDKYGIFHRIEFFCSFARARFHFIRKFLGTFLSFEPWAKLSQFSTLNFYSFYVLSNTYRGRICFPPFSFCPLFFLCIDVRMSLEVISVAIGYMQTGEHYANGDERTEYVFNNSQFYCGARDPVCLQRKRSKSARAVMFLFN